MTRLFVCLLAFSVLGPVSTLHAQIADPFGGPSNNDPFGNSNNDNPFGEANNDPFAPGSSKTRRPKPTTPGDAQPIVKRPDGESKPNSTSSHERIRAALNSETSLSFIETPLEDVVSVLSENHKIPILLDRRALEEVGLSTDLPVTLELKKVSLKSFLRLMLRESDLTYTIQNEVLLITTHEQAERNLTTEMYPFPVELADKSDQIIIAITSTVNPESWETTGGPASVAVVEHVLIVSATEPNHDAVVDFLNKLEAAFQAHVSSRK